MEMDARGVSDFFATTGIANQFIKFRRVRAGWYVARARRRSTGEEVVVHITRSSERNLRLGWDVRESYNEYELPPRMSSYLVDSGLLTMLDAEVEVEKQFERLPYNERCPACGEHGLGAPQQMRIDLGPRGLGETVVRPCQKCRRCLAIVRASEGDSRT